jgi:hypothetical protein
VIINLKITILSIFIFSSLFVAIGWYLQQLDTADQNASAEHVVNKALPIKAPTKAPTKAPPTNGAMIEQQKVGLRPPASPGYFVLKIANLPVVTVTGSKINIPSTVAAVVLRLMVGSPERPGFVSVWPCGSPQPATSISNYASQPLVTNGIIAPVNSLGEVCLFNSGTSQLEAFITGWLPSESFKGSLPKRLIDTRAPTAGLSKPIEPGQDFSIPIHGVTVQIDNRQELIPTSAKAVAITITIAAPVTSGALTVLTSTAGSAEPQKVAYAAQQILAHNTIVPIGSDGSITLMTSTQANVIIDLAGWFIGDVEEAFVKIHPTRVIAENLSLSQ